MWSVVKSAEPVFLRPSRGFCRVICLQDRSMFRQQASDVRCRLPPLATESIILLKGTNMESVRSGPLVTTAFTAVSVKRPIFPPTEC